MKVWITRNCHFNNNYEVWIKKPEGWNDCNGYYDDSEDPDNNLIMESIIPKEAKEMFKLDKHLKKKEIVEATMTFKIKK